MAPLRFGGGTRLKILEALARGVPVVTTSLGCEGLGLEHGRDALIADSPEAFASCVDRLMDDDDLCRTLAAAGRGTVEERYDWRVIGEALDGTLRELLTSARAAARRPRRDAGMPEPPGETGHGPMRLPSAASNSK